MQRWRQRRTWTWTPTPTPTPGSINLKCVSAVKRVAANQMYSQCDRCLKVGVACEPDPLHPCRRCQYNKQGCSLMPVNKITGKTERRNLTEAKIFRFRVSQLMARKKQQSRERKEPSGSRISPVPIHSSHSPPAASDSPAATTSPDSPIVVDSPSDAHPPPAATGLPSTNDSSSRAADFYVEVPPVAVIDTHPGPQASSPTVSITPPPTTTTTTAATVSTTDALNDSAPSSGVHLPGPVVDPSSSARASTSPCHRQRPPAPGNLAERTVSLAQLIDMFEDWMRRDEQWKDELNTRLQVAGI
jgi:hypothetical protein